METGLSTGAVFDLLGVDGAFKMFRDAGLECMDLGFDYYYDMSHAIEGRYDSILERPLEEVYAFFKPWKDAAEKYHVRINQAHAPFGTYQNGHPETNEHILASIRTCIALCGYLGTEHLVVHPALNGYTETMEPEEEHDVNIRLYTALIEDAKKYHVTICLENMFTAFRGKMYSAICSDPNEAAAYIDELNAIAGEKVFAFCFDTGHALLMGRDMYRFLKPLGSRVEVLHVHDNDGNTDLHNPAWFGKLDWELLIKGLRAIGYKGVLSCEHAGINTKYPRELLPTVYAYTSGVAHYLAAKVSE